MNTLFSQQDQVYMRQAIELAKKQFIRPSQTQM